MKDLYKKNAVVKTAVDTPIDGFDPQDKPITITLRAGAYYDCHSLTYRDNTYVDILLVTGEILPNVNRRKFGLTFIGDPEIHDNRTTEQKIAWKEELKAIDEEADKKNERQPIAPKTIHLNKKPTEQKEKKKSSSWFTKSDDK